MVTFAGKMDGRTVRAEVHGPHDVRGDSELVTAAAYFVRQRVPVQYGPPLGGGIASFEQPFIAIVTLAAVCDRGTAEFDGLDISVPDGADA